MYEIERSELLPTRLFAGDYPIVTDIATVKADTPIDKHTVVALTATGIETASAETLEDIHGITADAAEGGEDVVIYLTGEFKEEGQRTRRRSNHTTIPATDRLLYSIPGRSG